MSPKSLLKKTNNLYNPLDLKRRIDIYYDMQEGIEIKPNVPLPLNPKDLSHTQQNILIEHLKFNEAMLIIEIADYIKLTRQTVASRLKIINKESRPQLEDIGLSLWGVVYDLKRDVEFVKQKARNAGDYDLFLKASIAYINTCQKLGVIFEKPQELAINYPIHSEEDEKIIIAHYRRIELGLPIPSKRDTERDVVELIPDK